MTGAGGEPEGKGEAGYLLQCGSGSCGVVAAQGVAPAPHPRRGLGDEAGALVWGGFSEVTFSRETDGSLRINLVRKGLSGGGNQTLRGPQGPQGRKSRVRLEN